LAKVIHVYYLYVLSSVKCYIYVTSVQVSQGDLAQSAATAQLNVGHCQLSRRHLMD